MSLAIDIDRVSSVLLPDGWHRVMFNSFDIDAYEYVEQYHDADSGRHIFRYNGERQGSCDGFVFLDSDGHRMAGPMSSIIAVRYSLDQGARVPGPA